MKKGLIGFLVSSLVLCGGVAPIALLTAPVYAQSDEDTNIRVYKLASPAVVSIESGRGNGSGTIIDPKGLVLTNAHVVRGANIVSVTLSDKRQFRGTVIASSRNPDLAVIKLDDVTSSLPTIPIASSNSVQVGQRAFAIGNPFGRFAGTLTTGIISRIDRDRQLLQTDAALNPGNSGGPLLNSRGELVGVNTAIFTTGSANSGIGFAIEAETVRNFVAAVQRGAIASTPTPTPPSPTVISLDGNVISATLSPVDNTLPDGSYYKVYQFQGRAGQSVVIEMRGNGIDPYLVLFDPNARKIAEDDDSAGGKNARLVVTLPMTGRYTLYANSYEVGDTGSFTISGRVVNSANSAANTSSPSNTLGDRQTILQRSGNLGASSRIFAGDGSLFESFSFNAQAGQVVEIELTSSDFHPYLVLFAPNSQVLRENNGLPSRRKASMTIELPLTGTYQAIVNTFDRTGKGAYNLTVKRLR